MANVITRMWRYLGTAIGVKFDEVADPKIQLEQAIAEATDQHRRLKEQAANVIANQKQTELRLTRVLEELERVNGSARQAVVMASEAQQAGDETKATEYTQAAESFANRLIALEGEVDDLKTLHLQAAQAAQSAKEAVAQNSTALQRRLSERQKLLGQLDQAKMQEQVNSAMTSLNEQVGRDVPTLEEVRAKIEARYAKASGVAELESDSVETRMLEVEREAKNSEARARLDKIRNQLGLGAGDGTPEAAQPPSAATSNEEPTPSS